MSRRVVVVGAGAAGPAAAWAAARAGAAGGVVSDRPGASELGTGAVDDVAVAAVDAAPIEPDVAAFSAALGLWHLGERGVRLATPGGVVRAARGCDRALLDLAPLAGACVAVVDLGRAAPDARLLARGLAAGAWARATGTRFEPVAVDPPPALAGARGAAPAPPLAALGERLVAARGAAARAPDAWLLPAWPGLDAPAVAALRAALGQPLGEVTSRPGEVAGARFAQAREALLQVLAVERRAGRAVTVTAGPAVTLEAPPDGRREWLAADAVVLAVGGLIAGGVALDDAAAPGAPAFRLGVDADVRLALGGRALDPVASLHGVDLVELGLTALDRVGVDVDERGRVRVDADRLPTGGVAPPGTEVVLSRRTVPLWAAGGCVAERPRTLLEAVRAGIAAGRGAAGA